MHDFGSTVHSTTIGLGLPWRFQHDHGPSALPAAGSWQGNRYPILCGLACGKIPAGFETGPETACYMWASNIMISAVNAQGRIKPDVQAVLLWGSQHLSDAQVVFTSPARSEDKNDYQVLGWILPLRNRSIHSSNLRPGVTHSWSAPGQKSLSRQAAKP